MTEAEKILAKFEFDDGLSVSAVARIKLIITALLTDRERLVAGFRGVAKSNTSNTYNVQISNGKNKRVYRYGFKTPEAAARAYDELSKEIHGEFGIRNFKD